LHALPTRRRRRRKKEEEEEEEKGGEGGGERRRRDLFAIEKAWGKREQFNEKSEQARQLNRGAKLFFTKNIVFMKNDFSLYKEYLPPLNFSRVWQFVSSIEALNHSLWTIAFSSWRIIFTAPVTLTRVWQLVSRTEEVNQLNTYD